MKKLFANVSTILKQSAAQIETNWKHSRVIKGKENKLKMYLLLYFNIGFFLGYAAVVYISILYTLFGIIGGIFLGFTRGPFWFLLILLPLFALFCLYFSNKLWEYRFKNMRKVYLERHGLDVD